MKKDSKNSIKQVITLINLILNTSLYLSKKKKKKNLSSSFRKKNELNKAASFHDLKKKKTHTFFK